MHARNTVKPVYNGQNITSTFVGLKLILFLSKSEYTLWYKFHKAEYGTSLSEHSIKLFSVKFSLFSLTSV